MALPEIFGNARARVLQGLLKHHVKHANSKACSARVHFLLYSTRRVNWSERYGEYSQSMSSGIIGKKDVVLLSCRDLRFHFLFKWVLGKWIELGGAGHRNLVIICEHMRLRDE